MALCRSGEQPAHFTNQSLFLLLLVRVVLHFLRGLGVLGQHLRWSEFEIHLADRAGEGEGHLVVGVVHRRARVGPDVEGLVHRQEDRGGVGDAVVRDVLAIHPQHAGAALGQARPVVLEVKFESMLARE